MSRVEFFLGAGGVGKTTVSALSAISESLMGKKVLIATFDPSFRLKDILDPKSKFELDILNDNLKVVLLDPKVVFANLLENIDQVTAVNVKKNKLFRHLIERIQGVQEFSSLYFLETHFKSDEFDLIIIDTPPLQNSSDFFASPQKLKDLFESSIVRLFIGEYNKNWIEKIFKKSRDIAFATLKKLTGIEFFSNLISLMQALEKLQPVILDTLNSAQNILHSKNTNYSFVTTYELKNLENIGTQLEDLKEKGISIDTIFINKYEQIRLQEIENSLSIIKKGTRLSSYVNLLAEDSISKEKSISLVKNKFNTNIYTFEKLRNSDLSESDLINFSKEFKAYE